MITRKKKRHLALCRLLCLLLPAGNRSVISDLRNRSNYFIVTNSFIVSLFSSFSSASSSRQFSPLIFHLMVMGCVWQCGRSNFDNIIASIINIMIIIVIITKFNLIAIILMVAMILDFTSWSGMCLTMWSRPIDLASKFRLISVLSFVRNREKLSELSIMSNNTIL